MCLLDSLNYRGLVLILMGASLFWWIHIYIRELQYDIKTCKYLFKEQILTSSLYWGNLAITVKTLKWTSTGCFQWQMNFGFSFGFIIGKFTDVRFPDRTCTQLWRLWLRLTSTAGPFHCNCFLSILVFNLTFSLFFFITSVIKNQDHHVNKIIHRRIKNVKICISWILFYFKMFCRKYCCMYSRVTRFREF